MKSVCSNCGGALVHGNALGACSRCGHALTGALWTLEPPSRRRVAGHSSPRVRLVMQIVAGMLAGGIASFILFGLIQAEREAMRHDTRRLGTTQQALRPAPATGLSPGTALPGGASLTSGTSLLHANAPPRPLGALANADGGNPD
jgi:hypothetical protein